jgi:hypothetical protein
MNLTQSLLDQAWRQRISSASTLVKTVSTTLIVLQTRTRTLRDTDLKKALDDSCAGIAANVTEIENFHHAWINGVRHDDQAHDPQPHRTAEIESLLETIIVDLERLTETPPPSAKIVPQIITGLRKACDRCTTLLDRYIRDDPDEPRPTHRFWLCC